jgi:tRNA(Ile)-lysidine synthase
VELSTLEPPVEGPVAVAFSGGLDSTVLLHVLAQGLAPARRLRVLHVDHGLHPESARWAETCAATCATLGLGFQALRVQVVDRGEGLEAAARAARHAGLMQMQRPGELIALAHHQDDQAETVMLRLLRASGTGLAGMRPLRRFGSGWLWRPLLAQPKVALQA